MRQPNVSPPSPDDRFFAPASSEETIERLRSGNRLAWRPEGQPAATLAADYPVDRFGLPAQMPLATMIGCSDARVPPEILFGVGYNDLFIIRTAGNVLGTKGAGSLLYAAHNFAPPNHVVGRSMRAAVVVGHLGCGAVRGTIEMYQKGIAPGTATGGPLDSVMGEIAGAPLEFGVRAFEAIHGVGAAYRTENLATLLDLVIYLNAAHVARKARQWLDRDAMDASPHIAVVYGVVDPLRRCLHSRPAESVGDEPEPFASPPRDDLEFRSLADDIVRRLATSN